MNRLAGESSPYLRQHADNPVNWLPWGLEAFAQARTEDKPIFLSIGYSTCHWCHVMAHESFENAATAEILNRAFVSVKVDREERPDVDRVYMAFVQASTGSGGWPMSVWLTPELKPFFGGTYFPPASAYGRPGFGELLERIAQVWQVERPKIEAQSANVIEVLAGQAVPDAGGEIDAARANTLCLRQCRERYDPVEGGFGGAPKFPRPVVLQFLASQAIANAEALQMLDFTLEKMAAGGMCDQLGGGFHRYSVDGVWHVPHFEKMLYDQAQLAIAYLEGWQVTGNPAHAQIVRDILDYVLRDMMHPGGGFYAAEDADSLLRADASDHAEGAFYVWDQREIEELLGAEIAFRFCAAYGVKAHGNAPEGSDPHEEFTGQNILIRRQSADESREFSQARATLLAVRERRPRPHRDEKILTGWNGLMLSAFARAGRAFDEPRYVIAAEQACAFLRNNLLEPGTGELFRSWHDGSATVHGFADDYAFLIQGLLDLFETTGDASLVDFGFALQEKQDALFGDGSEMGLGGWFGSRANDPEILVRIKDDHDGAEPSASSVGVLNLIRLARLGGGEEFQVRAQACVRAFATTLDQMPFGLPLMTLAAALLEKPARQLVVMGPSKSDQTRLLLDVVAKKFLPDLILIQIDPDAEHETLARRIPHLAELGLLNGKPVAYLCENFQCRLPATSSEVLAQML